MRIWRSTTPTSHNGYFFYYDSTTSTQNLGNLDATYKGAELELTAKATDRLDLYANFGYTDGKITRMEDPTVVGNKPPLLTKNTVNAGAQYHQPIGDGLNGALRLDYQEIGRTWWDPYNVTSRDPVNLVNLRAGVEARALDGDRLVEESDRQDLQRRVFHGRLSLESAAAPLRGRFYLQVLTGKCTMAQSQRLPIRLHHNAYVTRDQEKTRRFYEEVIGMPLVATWCESDELFGKVRTYCHTFYGMADGGALAFFQFVDPEDAGGIRTNDAGIAVSSHRPRGERGDAGGHREAHCRCGHQAAGHLRAGARLLPLRLHNGPQRADPRVHARPSRGGRDFARPSRRCTQ